MRFDDSYSNPAGFDALNGGGRAGKVLDGEICGDREGRKALVAEKAAVEHVGSGGLTPLLRLALRFGSRGGHLAQRRQSAGGGMFTSLREVMFARQLTKEEVGLI